MRYLLVIILLFPTVCFSQAKDAAELQRMMAEIQNSHIEGNVPNQADFSAFLLRDLNTYFTSYGENITLKYQLLRYAPTQSGASYPKYYVWVQVIEDDTIVQEGGARIAAIEKKRFEVFDFVSKSDIQKKPSVAAQIFPSALLAKIYQLVGV